MDIFAPQFPFNFTIRATFVVKNIITDSNKTIKIFDYPIPVGTTRDLLKIPGVAEADIRASLLKGEIRNKILANEITIIDSDIDLLQFNDDQRDFLQDAGATEGISVGIDELGDDVLNLIGTGGGSGSDNDDGYLTAQEHPLLRDLVHFIEEGPGNGFASNAVRITSPSGSPFPTNITWYLDQTLTTKLIEKLIIYTSNQVPSTITWNLYDYDGITIKHSITDTYTYTNNVFESSRIRSIT